MSNKINKEKLINSINEKINYLNNDGDSIVSKSKANELKDLLYTINKGCFDEMHNNVMELDKYIKENSSIWDLTDTKEFLMYHKDDIIQILQRL